MKRTVILLLLTSCMLWSAAQKPAGTSKPKFASLWQIGALDGSASTAVQLQTINGIQFKTWTTGIGVGLDYYRFRSIPLFLDLRKDILNRKETPFLFGDIGMHFSWVKDSQKSAWPRSTYSNGLFYELGAGYKFGLPKSRALTFSAGYSFKSITEKNYGINYCPFIGPCVEGLVEKFDYDLKRLSVKAGFIF